MFYDGYYPKNKRIEAKESATSKGRKNYGTTPWGKEWLNALAQIDDSNRLPRGKTYANAGAVTSIAIEGEVISAKVQGSTKTPYKVSVKSPPLNAIQQEQVMKMVTENPAFLSALLNRELPMELNSSCIAEGVNLFPSTWRSLSMDCSCPDYAVPCKHLAAVMYIVANEIDKNPFLVFSMRGMDISAELEKAGYKAGEAVAEKIADIGGLFAEAPIEPGVSAEDEAASSDYSLLQNYEDRLCLLLPTQDKFYSKGTFKSILQQNYKIIAKQAQKSLKDAGEESSPLFKTTDHVALHLDASLGFVKAVVKGQKQTLLTANSLNELSAWLLALPVGEVRRYCSPMLVTLHTACLTAYRLAAKGCFLPKLYSTETAKAYKIFWESPEFIEQVKKIVDAQEKSAHSFAIDIDGKACYPKATAAFLLRLFLTNIVQQSVTKGQEEDIYKLFFNAEKVLFALFDTQETPNSINRWLKNFELSQQAYKPVFCIEEVSGGNFDLHIEVEEREQLSTVPVPLSGVLNDDSYKHIRMDIVQTLSKLAAHLPELNQLLQSKGQKKLRYSAELFPEMLFDVLPLMELFGLTVLLPKALRSIYRPKASLAINGKESVRVDYGTSILSMKDLLNFKWQVAIGDRFLTSEEFAELAKTMNGIVKINNQYVYLKESEVRALLKNIESMPTLDAMDLMQIALTEEYNDAKVELSDTVRQLLKKLFGEQKVELPQGLQANLRPYQQRGYEWMYRNAKIGVGSVIADDMGLGKTLQVIATLLKFKEEKWLDKGKALVVVPTTLLTNWGKEIERFAPTLRVHTYHGSARKWTNDDIDIVLTTYGVLRSEVAFLNKQSWAVTVIDEAQNVKNPHSEQSKAVKKINAPLRIAMSGTPVENRLTEYWSIFDFANKGYLKTLAKFKEIYAAPIELEQDKRALKRFKTVTAPFVMRRLKTDKTIISDLPDKVEHNQYCKLVPEQTALYEATVKNMMEIIEGTTEEINRNGLILKLLTALKQICNHPVQFTKKGKPQKELSGKALLLLDLLEPILAANEKVLIFTQYEQMGQHLVTILSQELSMHIPFLHGGLSRKERDEMVKNFQENAQTSIFILSLKAGGTGLNLTAANHVIHYDLWWNPAVEAQATDRAFRIGQNKNVQVHRFITQGTMEERIDQLLQSKKSLAEMTVATGEKWLGELSNAELKRLVAL